MVRPFLFGAWSVVDPNSSIFYPIPFYNDGPSVTFHMSQLGLADPPTPRETGGPLDEGFLLARQPDGSRVPQWLKGRSHLKSSGVFTLGLEIIAGSGFRASYGCYARIVHAPADG